MRFLRKLLFLAAFAFVSILALILAGFLWERSRWAELPSPDSAPRDQQVYDPVYLPAIEASRGILDRLYREHHLPAVSVSVGVGGALLFSETIGFADLETREPANLASRFRIGSVSKSVTTLAMARLLEAGKLDLDASIHEYLPDFPQKAHSISARQLASHQAGVRHYKMSLKWLPTWPPSDFFMNEQFDSVRASLAPFEDDPLLFEPGTDYNYTTHGFTLLSAVLEAAAGRDFLTLLDEEVFDPLGMQDSCADHAGRAIPGRVSFYEVKDERFRRGEEVNLSNKWAGGGLLSTTEDLVRMGFGASGENYLLPATLETLFEHQKLASGAKNPGGYALGWGVGHTEEFWGGRESFRVASHGGSSVGGSAYLLVFRDQGLVLAMLTNAGTGSRPLRDAVWEMAEPFMDVLKTLPSSEEASSDELKEAA